MTEPVFDPRHESRFQRGYQPSVHRSAAPADAAVPAHPSPPAGSHRAPTAPAATVAEEPAAAPAGAQAALLADLEARLEAIRDATASAAPAALVEILPDEVAEVKRSTRSINPFIIGLWVLGPVLVFTAVWGHMKAVSISMSRSSTGFDVAQEQFSMASLQLLLSFSPFTLAAGLATVIGLLFWHAWTWRTRHAGSAVRAASASAR